MTRNIKLVLEYDGTKYFGWQQQPDKITIQECLKTSINKLTREDVKVHGAGRTDTGVHAYGQVANFHTDSRIPDWAFTKAINAFLPPDIVVRESQEVPSEFHAQYSAKAKSYSYRMICRPIRPAIEARYAHWISHPLNLDAIKNSTQYLIGTHDFSSFEATNSPRKSSVRTVNYVDIVQESCYIKFLIEADGFLYHMVRNIVGTLLSVGRSQIDAAGFQRIVAAKDRAAAGPTVPAKGLFLECVKY